MSVSKVDGRRWIWLLIIAVGLLSMGQMAGAQENTDPGSSAASEPAVDKVSIPWIWWIAPISSFIALFGAWVMYKQVRDASPGDEKMIEIAGHVREGAYAYLFSQSKVVAFVFVLLKS